MKTTKMSAKAIFPLTRHLALVLKGDFNVPFFTKRWGSEQTVMIFLDIFNNRTDVI